MMTSTQPQAIARLQTFFADRATRPGVVARRLLGATRSDDERLTEMLCGERRARTRLDGSIGGSLVDTAWAAWEMMDLGLDAWHGGLTRLVSWVLAFLEGSPSESVTAPLVLPNGTVIPGSSDATFAAECLGLRVLLRARQEDRPGVQRRVARVVSLAPTVSDQLAASALAVMAIAPAPYRDALPGLVERFAAAQRTEGSWGEADLFQALEALLLAGIRPARAVIERAIPALLEAQRDDGSFDEAAHEERALIGLRALLVSQEDGPGR
jgi:hypothetical protein